MCEKQLVEIQAEGCKMCSRPLEALADQFKVGDCCYDCVRWEEDPNWKGYLLKNQSIYVYNEQLKEMLSQYKFRGDYILAKAFSHKIREQLRTIDYDLLVPIPLSRKRQYDRGFNQSEALIREAGFEPTMLLQRTHGEKQSKKSRNERIHLQQVFQLKEEVSFLNKKIVLVDDIYTTGSTLRQAAKILKKGVAKEVSAVTLGRG